MLNNYYNPIIIILLILSVVLLLVNTVQTQDIPCFNYGRSCPPHAPFCSGRLQTCSSHIWDGYLENSCVSNSSQPNACVAMPGCKSFRVDFNSPTDVVRRNLYNGNPDITPFVDDIGNTNIENGSLYLNMRWVGPGGGLTRVSSTRRFHYGTYSARIRMSAGKGLVYTWIFKTYADTDADGDEIDWEIVPGKDPKRVETNYYVNGVIDHTNAGSHLLLKPLNQWQTFTMKYMPNNLLWYIDDVLVRNLTAHDHIQTPNSLGQLFLSIWDTCGMAPGTVDWATGGNGENEWCNSSSPEHKNLTYRMAIDWIDVKCADGYEDITPVQVPIVAKGESNRGILLSTNHANKNLGLVSGGNLIISITVTFLLAVLIAIRY